VKYLHLIWAALLRRKARTIFTVLSVLTAFLLFGLLDTVRTAFNNVGGSVSGADRLVTVSKISFTMALPMSLYTRIQAVPGVDAVSYANWFGGQYQDGRDFFPSQAVARNFFDLYPEWQMPAAQRKAFRDTRTGAVVGETLAKRMGWKIGDKIPLQATIFPLKGGSNTWVFDLVGIYRVANPEARGNENNFWFNYDYFDEARQFGQGTVGRYAVKLSDPKQATPVEQAIDALSADSDHETKTETEQAFTAALVGQFADIGLIVGSIMGAVFFTLVLLTGNTMMQAVRERTSELAVLKTIGFSSTSVLAMVLAESVLLLLLGGLIGLGLVSLIGLALPAMSGGMITNASVGAKSWSLGIALAIAIGAVVGALPALRAMRLNIVDALAGR
jgi:putative ABC transport system permease protein